MGIWSREERMVSTEKPSQPKMIGATLLLEQLKGIDYRLMSERVGGVLGIDAAAAEKLKPGDAMVLPISGNVAFGLQMDFPFPDVAALQRVAPFAYWWPDALRDLARHRAHLMVHCAWANFSRMDGHMRHLVLMRELVEQLPVVGVLWGSALVQTDLFKGEFANSRKGAIPFSLWVLIQFSRQPNGNILISTVGMRDFEQMEIETESSLQLDQTFDFVRKFGSYVLASGAVVKDGDTVGLTAEQRIKVRHTRSFRPDVNDMVYWIEFVEEPTVRKPTGLFSRLFGSETRH
jgi:Domain of unknown function (DUF4261)